MEVKAPICCKCSKPGMRVKGKAIYPKSPGLWNKDFYQCVDHKDIYSGCHLNGDPFGPLMADKELRNFRQRAHDLLDQFWLWSKDRRGKRKECYKRLAKELNLKLDDCHIGHFDHETAKKAIEVLQEW